MTGCDGITRAACLGGLGGLGATRTGHRHNPPSPPAINRSHHRGTKEVGSCNRNNKVMSHSRPSGMRLCLCLCPVLIRKGRENGVTEPRGRPCPMHVGPSRSFSLRDNHLRTPSLRQNSPRAAIWHSPVPSLWTPRAVQWLDELLPGSWKLELDWSRGRGRGRARWNWDWESRRSSAQGPWKHAFPGGLVRLVDHQISRTSSSPTIIFPRPASVLARAGVGGVNMIDW